MALLTEIRESAVNSSEPLSDLLRKCKVLAVRLANKDFVQWVDAELTGYSESDDLPDFRLSDVRSVGYFIGSFGSEGRNFPIPPSNIKEKWRHHVTQARFLEPVAAYEDLLRNKDTGTFHSPWPADLIKSVSQDIYKGLVLNSATKEIPRGVVVALVDAVRNRILNFILDLEAIAPRAGEHVEDSAISPDRVQQIFNTHIHGDVANVAAGSQITSQSAEITIVKGDMDSLKQQLATLGLNDQDISELQKAITEDSDSGKRIGPRIGNWLGKVIGKAGEGALKVGVNTASEVLPRLISQYLGHPY